MFAFAGMNMAAQAGGVNAGDLYNMAAQQKASAPTAAPAAAPAKDSWTCSCGHVNKGKFCSECGAKKPASAPLYRCDKCGWEPEDPQHPPR